jgi:hypothetical protein
MAYMPASVHTLLISAPVACVVYIQMRKEDVYLW